VAEFGHVESLGSIFISEVRCYMQSPSLITCHKVRNFPWFMPDDDPDMGGIRVASIDHCGSWCWH